MTAMQKLVMSTTSTGGSNGSCRADLGDAAAMETFPAGLRVLVVDDDVTCLKILEHMLQKCLYHVTTCTQAMKALSLLRERKGGFDVVISDVHMPDMDGFKLLELVGLEMDLPVIMMSADGRTSAVMRGIKHGACDYLIKPVRIEELKNIWQHVVRKKWNGNKDFEQSASFEESDCHRQASDEAEYVSSVHDGTESSWKTQKKKRDSKDDEDDGELENEDPSAPKKPRVVWSVELHQQFVNAVNQLGIDKAVPKRILELMNVPGLTRENVASHLQKFRLYLKRISGVTQHQNAFPGSFCYSTETNSKVGLLGSHEFHCLASSGQIPPQALSALHAELLGQPSGTVVSPVVEKPVILQPTRPNSLLVPGENALSFDQPIYIQQTRLSKQFPPSRISLQDGPSNFLSWPPNLLGLTGSTDKLGGLCNNQNNALLMQMFQHQHQQDPFFPVVSESHCANNVQPSCLLLPITSLNSLNGGSSSVPINLNQNSAVVQSKNIQEESNGVLPASVSAFNVGNVAFDYGIFSSQSNDAPLPMGTHLHGGLKNIDVLSTSSPPLLGSTPASSSSFYTSNDPRWRLQNSTMDIGSLNRLPGHLPSLCIQGSELMSMALPNQGQIRNLGLVGKGSSLPSRFAIDNVESPLITRAM
ncbi:hypothetical protein HPP92_020308 [Vanilla planifolia]|uniref:Two-component response regulator n=1 Tax=Vanilla planifolia TaxID=51239 RepID=A0A835Q245_VANPL|nr:hypothetical protein HPP92_020308 [Vanilla planifolia]